MMGVSAEFERAMIQERVRVGLRRANEAGTKSGKPIGRPTIEPELEARIRGQSRRWRQLPSYGRDLRRCLGHSAADCCDVAPFRRAPDRAGCGVKRR
jgi:hypothetical protein